MSHHDKHSSSSSSGHKSSSSSKKSSHSSSSSSTHHHADTRLHKLKGAKWKAFIKVSSKLYDTDDDERNTSKKKHSNTVMRLDRNDMFLYGLCPETDLFVAVLCDICGATLKPHGFAKHVKNRHHADSLLFSSEKLTSLDNLMSNQNLSELQEILSNANLINSSASSSSGSKQKHSKSSNSGSSGQKSSSSSGVKSSSGRTSSYKSSTAVSQSQCSSPATKSLLLRASSNPPDYFNSSSSSNSLDSVALSGLKAVTVNPTSVLHDVSQQLKQIQSQSQTDVVVKIESHSSSSKSSSSSSSKKNKRKLSVGVTTVSPANSVKNQSVKDREYDADRHCGVINFETNNPCLRSLTCKSHALSLRRSVIGRSKSFDTLLQDQKMSRDGKPPEMTDSNSNLSFDSTDFKGAVTKLVSSESSGKTSIDSSKFVLKEKIKSDPELLSTSSVLVPDSPSPTDFTISVKQEKELDIDDTYTFMPDKIEDFSETLETLGQQSKQKRDSQKQQLLFASGLVKEELDENLQKLVQQKVQAKHEERERQQQIVLQPTATTAADIIAQQFAEENPNTILTDATILMDPTTNVVQVSVSGTIKTTVEQNGLEAVTQMTQNFNPTDPLTVTVPMSMLSVMTNIHMTPTAAEEEANQANQTVSGQLEDVSEFVGLDDNVVQTNAYGTEESAWFTTTGGQNEEMVAAGNNSEYSEVPLYFQFDDGSQAVLEDEQTRALNASAVAAAAVRSGGEDIIYLASDTFADTNMSINPHQILSDSTFLATATDSVNDSSQNSYSILENHQQMVQQTDMFEGVDPSLNHHTSPITFSLAAASIPDTANLQLLTPITKPSKADVAAAAATASAASNNCSSSDEDNICCDLKTWYTSIPKPITVNTFGMRRVGGGVTTNRKMLAFRKSIINDKSYINSPTTNHRSGSGGHYNEIIISSINHKSSQDFVQLTNGLQNTNSHSLFVNKTQTPASRGRRFVSVTMTKKSAIGGGDLGSVRAASPTKYKKLLLQDPLFQSLLKSSEPIGGGRQQQQASSSSSNHVGGGQKRDHHEMNNHDTDNGYMQLHAKRPKLNMKSNRDLMLLSSSSPPNSLMNNGKPPSGSNNGTTLSPVHQKLPRIF